VRDYLEISDDIPHTFLADLGPAALGSQPLDEHQLVIRLESLVRPLGKWGRAFDDLRQAHAANDLPVLQGFLNHWNNSNVRDSRPSFAAWRDQLIPELEAPDCPERLRDRLGLEHYDCRDGPIPVAVMQYRLREVMDTARALGLRHGVTAPTVIDSRPGPYFFPAPKELPYGRAMSLAPVDDENQLLAELLHVRLLYRPEHIIQLDEIRRPPVAHDLKALRNNHLFVLQVASGRGDVGEEID
jgi:hypothetical protein